MEDILPKVTIRLRIRAFQRRASVGVKSQYGSLEAIPEEGKERDGPHDVVHVREQRKETGEHDHRACYYCAQECAVLK